MYSWRWGFRLLLFWLLPGCLVPATTALWAQSADLAAFKQTESEVVLLRNAGDLIPLGGLDTLRLGVLAADGNGALIFSEILRRYHHDIEELVLPPTLTEENARRWVAEYAAEFDVLVLVIRDEPVTDALHPYEYRRALLRELVERKRLITVVFDPIELFERIPALEASEGVIVAPYNYYGQSLAAQVVFGGLAARGQLRNGLSRAFPEGSGIRQAEAVRLGYAIPEAASMDGQLLRDSIQAIVEEGIRAHAYPGAQVLVARKGKIVYHECFGFHTYDSLRPVSRLDIYDMASVTKVSTGLAALMKWYGEGKLDLDAPLGQYFDGWKRSNKDAIPLRPILAHQARLRPWIPYWQETLKGHGRHPWRKRWDATRTNDYRFRKHTLSRDSSAEFSIRLTDRLWQHRDFREKIYRSIRKSPLREEAGYAYSGLFFYLLPEIVENLSGMEYETFLKQTFYEPLGATTLTYNPLRFFDPKHIVPTERDTFFRMELLHGTVHDEGAAMMGGVSGNAGLFGGAEDLAKLFTMYMNYGAYGGERYIAEAAVREFARCQYCEEGNYRGLGFDKPLIEYDPAASSVAEAASPLSFGHSGYTGTFVWADPEAELLFIFLSNRVYPTRLNRQLYERSIRPRIHKVLYDAMVDADLGNRSKK